MATRKSLRTRRIDAPMPAYRSDQLLVTVATDARVVVRETGGLESFAVAPSALDPFAALERDGLIESVTAVGRGGALPERAAPGLDAASFALAESLAPAVDAELAGLNLVRLAPGASVAEVKRRLDDAAAVQEVERVPFRAVVPRPSAKGAGRSGASATASWNLREIAWKSGSRPSAKRVKVAVLDTGVDDGHEALSIAAYHHDGVSAEDIVGHGTHVAGVIAGKAMKTRRLYAGVSNAELHVWKIFSDEPDPETGWFLVDEVLYLRALLAVLESGCAVANLSIGAEGTNRSEERMFRRIIAGGVTVVAAMGNEYRKGNPVEYPAAHPDVIAVGAVGRDLGRAKFSNTGDHITLVAPGVAIPSTLPRAKSVDRTERNYAAWDGTSMATPHVAAAAARLIAAGKATDPASAKAALEASAKKLPVMRTRPWTRTLGHGLLQA